MNEQNNKCYPAKDILRDVIVKFREELSLNMEKMRKKRN